MKMIMMLKVYNWFSLWRGCLRFYSIRRMCLSDTNFESDFRVLWIFFPASDIYTIECQLLRDLFLFVVLFKMNHLLYYFYTTNWSVSVASQQSQYLPYKVMISSKILCCLSSASSKVVSLLWLTILELCVFLTVAQLP